MVKHSKGFTLIELLVVIVILAVMTSLVALSVQRSDDQRLLASLDRLVLWCQDLADRAVLGSQVLGVQLSATGLEPLVWREGRWQRLQQPAAFMLERAQRLQLWGEVSDRRQLIADSEQVALVVDAVTDRAVDSALELNPQMILMPTGQVLPAGIWRLSEQQQQIERHWPAPAGGR